MFTVRRTPRTWVVQIDDGALAADALPAALEEVRAEGGGPTRWWITEPSADDEATAASLGLAPERALHQLRRELPIGEPFDIAVRAFVPGQDEEAWLRVNNRAFDWHPEQGGWTIDQIRAQETEPWFDPAGFLLHEDDASGRLAGFVWTKVHPATDADPRMGEIYVIGVDPFFGGRGLGRALTLAGLDWLHRERDITVAMLYVDANNTPAIKLYDHLGFERHHTDRSFLGYVQLA